MQYLLNDLYHIKYWISITSHDYLTDISFVSRANIFSFLTYSNQVKDKSVFPKITFDTYVASSRLQLSSWEGITEFLNLTKYLTVSRLAESHDLGWQICKLPQMLMVQIIFTTYLKYFYNLAPDHKLRGGGGVVWAYFTTHCDHHSFLVHHHHTTTYTHFIYCFMPQTTSCCNWVIIIKCICWREIEAKIAKYNQYQPSI